MNDLDGYVAFRPAFERVLDQRLYTIEWLDEQVATGAVMFWRSPHAAIIAELKHYPTGASDIHGMLAAGDLNEIAGLLIPHAEAWARQQGCIGAVIESREGWSRVLKTQGYRPYQIAVRKEL